MYQRCNTGIPAQVGLDINEEKNQVKCFFNVFNNIIIDKKKITQSQRFFVIF